ncbi:glycosyltransferase family 4 protein [Clostridium beijerinckii]|uniref:Glycosyltransferase involved in cell wall biosynthesis n=1 Tax=Clostridium beijerinckii TaxID=1520 RepID=A0A9Q5CJ83_CLOBE|nr:glycosyltransferase family 4 protein [Clostridium beijerinckii]AQS03697.1 putative glycosyl transferase [Clostridium beijerinckii]MBA2887426.1 glycosyltransferase involved in cell wall biosynthesis [Clostridium beijerinckii]MBA2902316.1 glycosyltransferase involved in cell wall biosynthesis [Clostridium beijerinckii]MBA2912139.1 glycosyltransferase involved in cell wall biosynthesis [Clostridium beijerinckii]MBA9016758.1 glycosyltransferase involved in cell wall biosynthesis [Clostridium be
MRNVKKKLLVYAHYYYPDVASTGQILKELCEGMKDKFDITVICTVPSYSGKVDGKYTVDKYYNENINEVKVIRVKVPEFSKENKKSRIKNLLTYFFRAVWATLKLEKQDYIFTISQPPILGGALGVIGKLVKGGKLIYNIQDFNPEQTMAVGYSKNKFILNFAMAVDKFSCKIADKVIVVGRDMQETLKNRFKNKNVPKNVFINNWIDEKEIYPLPDNDEKVIAFKRKYSLEDKTIIMYSGNIGLYYDLENLIKVIGKFNDREDVVFAFIGDGSKKLDIENYVNEHNLTNVKFIPYQDKKDLIYSLNSGDIHWVVNAKGIKGVSVPSKLYGVMAAGKTVFGVLDEGSEARLIIEDCKCGVCIEPGKYDFIYEELKKVIDNIHEYKKLGIRGKEYVDKYIKKDVAIQKYSSEILCED